MDHGFCPFERCGGLVVRFDELVNRLAQLPWRRETHALERLLAQDAEPTFHLIQPRGIGWGEMQVDFGMALQPPIVFGLVSVQVGLGGTEGRFLTLAYCTQCQGYRLR